MKRMVLLGLLLCLFVQQGNSQSDKRQARIDSLQQLLPKASDQDKLTLYMQLGGLYFSFNPSQSLHYASAGLQLSEKMQFLEGVSYFAYFLGNISHELSNDSASIRYLTYALAIETKRGEKEGMATIMNNLGAVYEERSNYPKALENYFGGLRLFEQLEQQGDSSTMLSVKNGMANS